MFVKSFGICNTPEYQEWTLQVKMNYHSYERMQKMYQLTGKSVDRMFNEAFNDYCEKHNLDDPRKPRSKVTLVEVNKDELQEM